MYGVLHCIKGRYVPFELRLRVRSRVGYYCVHCSMLASDLQPVDRVSGIDVSHADIFDLTLDNRKLIPASMENEMTQRIHESSRRSLSVNTMQVNIKLTDNSEMRYRLIETISWHGNWSALD